MPFADEMWQQRKRFSSTLAGDDAGYDDDILSQAVRFGSFRCCADTEMPVRRREMNSTGKNEKIPDESRQRRFLKWRMSARRGRVGLPYNGISRPKLEVECCR